MKKQERQEYVMHIENLFDTIVRIQEDRNISYGEIYYVENLKMKELRELENELYEELERIIEIVKDYM